MFNDKNKPKGYILVSIHDTEEEANEAYSTLYVEGFRNIKKVTNKEGKIELQIVSGTRGKDLHFIFDELSVWGHVPILIFDK